MLEWIVDIACFTGERPQSKHLEALGHYETLEQIARLLLGHRNHEVSLVQQLGMTLQVGRSGAIIEMDADIAQDHPGVERD